MPPKRSAPDLGQAISGFQTHMVAKGNRPSTVKSYTDSNMLLVAAFGTHADPTTVTLDDLEAIVATWKLNPNTKRNRIAAWRGLWKWGNKRHGWANIAAELDLPRRSEAVLRRLTRDEVEAMLTVPLLERPRTVVWFLSYTAVRISELIRTRWRDIDLVAGRLLVSAEAKGQKGRTVPLPDGLVAYLAAVKDARGDLRTADKCYLIPRRRRGQFLPEDERIVWTEGTSQMSVGRMLKAAASAAGVRSPEDVTAHMFRRFYLEHMLETEPNIYVAMAIAGHESMQTTAKYGGRASLAATTRAVRGISFGDPPDGPDGRTWVRTKAVSHPPVSADDAGTTEPERPDSGGNR